MFSARIPWPLAPNALAAAAAARRRAGAEVLDLTASNPTAVGLRYPAGEVLAALADPRALAYEPDARGAVHAREAVAAYYASARGAAVDPARVLLTASTSEAYALLFKLLCDPGDRVLVPRPSYPLFEHLAALEGVAVDAYPLGFDGAWHTDVAAVERAASDRTRAVVVVDPNNPTGTFLQRDERAALGALCARRGMALVADEVFADYAFAPDARRAPTAALAEDCLAFALAGLSKPCALPQVKLAWIVSAGPPALRAAAEARLELAADTYLSVSAPAQHGAAALLRAGEDVRRQIIARTRANLAHARAALAAEPGCAVTALPVDGGWYLTLRLPALATDERWALDLLTRDGVLVHPGYFYDFATEALVVVSLLAAEGVFREGVARLLARVRARLAAP